MGRFSSKLASAIEGLSFDDVLLLPRYSDIKLDSIDISTEIAKGVKLKIPILSSPMDTVTNRKVVLELGSKGGLGVLPRNVNTKLVLTIISEAKERKIPVAAAVGPFDDNKVSLFAEKGINMIVIDTAHGHSKNVIEATRRFKNEYGLPIMSGNVATGEGAEALISAGADVLRVGVGSGHACTTREITGVGVPQLTAISWVADVAKDYGVGVVADGGIEKPSDMVKALAAGADAVMLGYLIAGSKESAGSLLVTNDGKLYKQYRGMGSKSALKKGSPRYGEFKNVPEGVEGFIEIKGSLSSIIDMLINSLKQAMGYLGAATLAELKEKAIFIKITNSGLYESKPRGFLILERD